jgi:hypothetical protein
MSFDWMHAPHTPNPDQLRHQIAREISEKAAMLRRLGYGQEGTAARCLLNLEWEFEVGPAAPLAAADVAALVKAVYDR